MGTARVPVCAPGAGAMCELCCQQHLHRQTVRSVSPGGSMHEWACVLCAASGWLCTPAACSAAGDLLCCLCSTPAVRPQSRDTAWAGNSCAGSPQQALASTAWQAMPCLQALQRPVLCHAGRQTLPPARPWADISAAAPQGSNDGLTWTSLRQHVDDRTIRMPGQYASWPVAGAGASHPYSQLRIRLNSPTASPNGSSRNLCLSFIELYGYLFQPANLQ